MKTKLEQGDVVIFDGETYAVSGVTEVPVDPPKHKVYLDELPVGGERRTLMVPGSWVDALAGNVYGKQLTIIPRESVQAIRGTPQFIGGGTISIHSAERPD